MGITWGSTNNSAVFESRTPWHLISRRSPNLSGRGPRGLTKWGQKKQYDAMYTTIQEILRSQYIWVLSGNDCYIAIKAMAQSKVRELSLAWIVPYSHVNVHQRLNLHFPRVFPWFSDDFPIFLWLSRWFLVNVYQRLVCLVALPKLDMAWFVAPTGSPLFIGNI